MRTPSCRITAIGARHRGQLLQQLQRVVNQPLQGLASLGAVGWRCLPRLWLLLTIFNIVSSAIASARMIAALALFRHLQRSQELCSLGFYQARAFAAASAQLTAIRTLRERTSAPISDVKSALVETAWDEGAATVAYSSIYAWDWTCYVLECVMEHTNESLDHSCVRHSRACI